MAVLTAADEDVVLGAGLKAGDSAAIAALYEKYKHHIHEFAARVLDDRTRAEDIAQLTFLRAMERSGSLDKPARVRP